LTVELLESRDLLSGFTLGPLVQVSGPSPFTGNTADNVAGQPGINYLNTATEPSIAVNPTNPRNIVETWMQDQWSNDGGRGIVAAVSTNGGNSWKSVEIPGLTLVSGGTFHRAADTWLSFAPNGDLYSIAIGENVGPNGNFTVGSTLYVLQRR
jgi:hypothetical protein